MGPAAATLGLLRSDAYVRLVVPTAADPTWQTEVKRSAARRRPRRCVVRSAAPSARDSVRDGASGRRHVPAALTRPAEAAIL